MSIISVLEKIKKREIVLPDIQRDFVWEENSIEKLFDSIMRSYPIGMVLLWDTYADIQYRHFLESYPASRSYDFENNSDSKNLKIVLDGQQRLQSLFIALYGKYNKKELYCDILSGREKDNFEEEKYVFKFYNESEVQKANTLKIQKDKSEENERRYFFKVKEVLSSSPKGRRTLKNTISQDLTLSEDDTDRLELNIDLLSDVITRNENILKTTIIDENKPQDSEERKNVSDILEAFVRINTEGTRLTRSDLIFSMLKLNWKESATRLPEFVEQINEGNSFEVDTDFVIRCLFAVSELGTKFDVNLLRNKKNVEALKSSYSECCDSIRSTLDFVKEHCWIESSKLLGGLNNLVPFVYYLYHTDNHMVPDSEVDNVRKSLYLFGFSTPFSRYGDSRLATFIREEIKTKVAEGNQSFPLNDAVWRMWYWENIDKFGPELVQRNPELMLHLVQHRKGGRLLYTKNMPQIDHIFPRSKLKELKFKDNEINHFANFWILAKGKNQNKSNKDPKVYFKNVNNSELKAAHINYKLLEYSKYKEFLREREKLLLDDVKKKLDLKNYDYTANHYYNLE
jgi:hypothetical protein